MSFALSQHARNMQIRDWSGFYARVPKDRPSFLAREALARVDFKGRFLDMGCGTCNDILFALNDGFDQALGIDASHEAIVYAKKIHEQFGSRFRFSQVLFEEFDFGTNKFDWINANFTLSFANPHSWPRIFKGIHGSLSTSGVCSVTMFGHEDYRCNPHTGVTPVMETELQEFFPDCRTVTTVVNFPGVNGTVHYFRVIAKKSDSPL